MWIILFNLIFGVYAAELDIVQIEAQPDDIRQPASYFISIVTKSTISANGTIQITFPQEFTNLPQGSGSWDFSSQFSASSICRFDGQELYVEDAFTEDIAPSILTFTIYNIENPQFATTTDSFVVITRQPNNDILDFKTKDLSLQFEPGNLDSVIISAESQRTGEESVWTISFVAEYEIPAGGYILVTFPFWNVDMGTTNLQPYISSTPTWTINTINEACSFSNNELQISTTSSITTVELQINSVKNPPSTQPRSGFRVSTWSTNGEIETSQSLQFTATSPNELLISSIFLSDSKINVNSDYQFILVPSNPVPAESTLTLTFPTEIEISFAITNTVTGTVGIKSGLRSFDLDGQTITISDGFDGYSEPNAIILSVANAKNPISTKESGEFSVAINTPDGYAIDEYTGGSITATPGTLTDVRILATEKTINSVTTYTFEFMTSNLVPAGGGIRIQLPEEISAEDRPAAPCKTVILGLDPLSQCLVTNQNTIELYSAVTSEMPASTLVRFQLDRITNSKTTEASSPFLIETYQTETFQFQIDISNDTTFTADPGTLSSVIVTPASFITGAATNYTFEMQTNNPVVINGIINVTFPSSISMSSGSACSDVVGLEATYSCSIVGSTLTIQNAFLISEFPSGTIRFNVSNVTNPRTTKPTESFTVGTYTENDFPLDTLSQGIQVSMTQANNLVSVNISPASLIVNDLANYEFIVQAFNPLMNETRLDITVPSGITLTSSTECIERSSTVSIESWTQNGNTLEITLTPGFTPLTVFVFRVDSIRNPNSTKPSDSFALRTFEDGYAMDELLDDANISMTTPNALSHVSIVPDTYLISQTTSYTITFTTSTTLSEESYLEITLAPDLSVDGTVACSPWLCTGSSIVRANMFTTGSYDPGVYSLVLTGLRNSETAGESGQFTIGTYTKDDFAVDRDTDATVTFICADPCLTWETTPTTCTSCDKTSSEPYAYDGTCNSQCPDQQADPGDKTCVPCPTQCLSCNGATLACTSCDPDGTAPYLYNDDCNEDWPEFQYKDNGTCVPWVSPWASCIDASQWTSCAIQNGQQTLLLENQCYTKWPSGYMTLDNTVCNQCDSNCSEWQGALDNWTACPDAKVLYQGTCLDSCPADVTIKQGSICVDCDSNCTTCTVSPTTWVTCIVSQVLYQSTCLQQCPSETTILIGVEWQDCTPPCSKWEDDLTTCTSCATGSLYEAGCVDDWPDGNASVSQVCQQCDELCTKCVGSVSNWTECEEGTKKHRNTCVTSWPLETTIEVDDTWEDCIGGWETCIDTVEKCITCISGRAFYEDRWVAVWPSSMTDIEQVCQDCSENCLSCSGTVTTWTSCPSGSVLYNGNCVGSWPVNTSIELNNEWFDWDDSCFTCSSSTTNWTSCRNTYYTYENSCVTEWPAEYEVVSGVCVKAIVDPPEPPEEDDWAENWTQTLLLNDVWNLIWNTTEWNYDNQACAYVLPVDPPEPPIPIDNDTDDDNTEYSTEISISQFPFPFSILCIAALGFVTALKLAGKTSFTKLSISVIAPVEILSWIACIAFVAASDSTEGPEQRRRLVAADLDIEVLLGFVLLCLIFVLFIWINFYFVWYMKRKVIPLDQGFEIWILVNQKLYTVMIALSLFTYKIFKWLTSRINWTESERIIRVQLNFTFATILVTTFPIMAIMIYLLNVYSTGNTVFLVLADSLIVTGLVLALSIWDIVLIKSKLEGEQLFSITVPTGISTLEMDQSASKPFVEMHNVATTTIGDKFDTEPSHTVSTLEVQMIPHEFTMDTVQTPDLYMTNLGSFRQLFPKRIKLRRAQTCDEPRKFSDITRRWSFPSNDIEDVDIDFDLPERLFTQVDHDIDTSFENLLDGESLDSLNLSDDDDLEELQDLVPLMLDAIPEEEDLDLEAAETDEQDPEVVTAAFRESGRRVVIRKDFEGARLVDLEGKVLRDSSPIKSKDYDMPNAKVEKFNVKFATVRDKLKNEPKRVMRDFRGAKIMDLETKVGSGKMLIGRKVRRESDFDIDNALVDPKNPDNIIAIHKKTGLMVKISKSFNNAAKINELTNRSVGKIENLDRKSIEVNPMDVHLAFGSTRKCLKRNLIKRSFRGAKVIDVSPKFVLPEPSRELDILDLEDPRISTSFQRSTMSSRLRKSRKFSTLHSPKLRLPENKQPLKQIYGPNINTQDLPSELPPRPWPRRKVKMRKPNLHRGVRDLETIYLQRLEVRRDSKTPNSVQTQNMPMINPFINGVELYANSDFDSSDADVSQYSRRSSVQSNSQRRASHA